MSIISPNMSLVIPTVGSDAGPVYAQDVNASLTTIDQHNHSPGSGVQINPSGININSSLAFNNNLALNVAGVTLVAQGSTPANNTIYELGNDLHYVNGAGLDIQITNSSGVVGSPGSISNLNSPASATYVAGSSTFVWQSNTNIAANMDFGSAIMRNLSPNSTNAVTLSPPATLGSNYNLTLPQIPSSLSFMTLDTSGNMAGTISTSGGITGTNIASATITGTNIAAATITGSNIASATVAVSNMASVSPIITNSSGNFTTTSTVPVTVANQTIALAVVAGRPVFINFIGDNSSSTTQGAIGNSNGTGLAQFAVIRDSAQLSKYTQLGFGSQTFAPAGSLNTIDIPPSTATVTYTLQCFVNAGAQCSVSSVRMQIFQL